MWRRSLHCARGGAGDSRPLPFERIPGVKKYDAQYFQRWYHNPGARVVTNAERARRVAMTVSMAEFVLERKLRSVLDVGCGEAPWQPILRRLRPGISYTGVDSSEYAVKRFGKRRGIVFGTFSGLADAVVEKPYDLVIASDVIHYLSRSELEAGLPALARRVGALAYLDLFTSGDNVEGDLRQMKMRPARYYFRVFRKHGLVPIGLQLYCRRPLAAGLASMERRGLRHSDRGS